MLTRCDLLALLDLTAAFETVDHHILLQRLQCSFGIDATVLHWFESYVTGRTQAVHLCGTTTSSRSLVCGVPQGSVLGPLLFVLYTADIGSIIKVHKLLHHCYADDTQMYFYCRPSECATLKANVLSCIDAVADWMTVNKLRLNPSKSEFVWCATLRRRHHISKECFILPDCDVQPVGIVRNREAFFDSDMNMKTHVNRRVSSCYYQLQRIRSIRRSIPTMLAITLMTILYSTELTIATVCS